MNDKIYSINELKEIIIPILQKYEIKEAYLFGSYACNKATKNSDIDLAVKSEESKIKTLFIFFEFEEELKNALAKDVDVVMIETLKEPVIPTLLNEQMINEQKVIIYAGQ